MKEINVDSCGGGLEAGRTWWSLRASDEVAECAAIPLSQHPAGRGDRPDGERSTRSSAPAECAPPSGQGPDCCRPAPVSLVNAAAA